MAEEYGTEGPICPHCRRQFTADEQWYYDDALRQMDCDDCGKAFAVEVYTRTSWTTNPITDHPPKGFTP